MCKEILILLFVSEMVKVGVMMELLSGLSGGTIFMGRHTGLASYPVLYFCPDLNFAMCLVMAAFWSCVWEFTWYALCWQSLKQNPLISHRRKACSVYFWTLFTEQLISSLVSLRFHPLSVD